MDLPNEALDTLKCTCCKQYLSIFPIHSDENGYLNCGRCTAKSHSIPTSRIVKHLETTLQFIIFPCANQKFGCNSLHTPKQMKNHEDVCKYKQQNCFLACQWRGSCNQMRDHIESEHMDLFIDVGNIEIPDENATINGLISWNNGLFLFYLENVDGKMLGNVYLVDGDELMEKSMFKWSNNIESTCFIECFEKKVQNARALQDQDKILLNYTDLKNIESCKIEFFNSNLMDAKQDDSIQKLFVCKTCKVTDLLPLFFCPNCYHSFCYNCSIRVCKECNQCMNSPEAGLEKIASLIKRLCVNPGCQIIYTFNEKDAHENICSYQLYKCPILNCTFSNRYNLLLDHFKNAHQPLVYINKIESRFDKTFCEARHLLLHNDRIYIQSITFPNYQMQVNLIQFFPKQNLRKSMIEINLENGNDRIYVKSTQNVPIVIPDHKLQLKNNTDNVQWNIEIKMIDIN